MINYLKTDISTDLDRFSKVLNIKVKMPESDLSAVVANNIVKSLDNYIRTQKKILCFRTKILY